MAAVYNTLGELCSMGEKFISNNVRNEHPQSLRKGDSQAM
jgi:hypothetical protein